MKYGRYDIVKELGKGSMGVVYQAHDPSINRMIALKVLRPDLVTSEEFMVRFVQEARAVGRLSHPNVVVVHDIGEDHGTVYISMELLEGKPLDELIREKTSLSVENAVRLGAQVAEALDYAHKRGIIHRDIKPSNIIVLPDGQAKITDFGIAHIEDPEATRRTQAGTILGTPAYMSPEQALGQDVDGRADIFSLGIILYEMTAGKRPFGGDNIATLLRCITCDDPPEPSKVNNAAPRELSRIIMKCLAKSPEKRFANGKELADALKCCLGDLHAVPAGRRLSLSRMPHARALVAVVSAVVVLMLGGVFAYLKLNTPGSGPADNDRRPVTNSVETSAILPPAPPPDLTPRIPAGMHNVVFESNPPGASIIVDGTERGQTPGTVPLPAGRHEVQIVMAGYPEFESSVMVGENKQNRVNALLDVLQQDSR